jgi:plasmid replication initiation protein
MWTERLVILMNREDEEKGQRRVSLEELMKEFDILKENVLEKDLVNAMKQKYDLSDHQSNQLITEAKTHNLLIETRYFGKPGYLKRDTRFSPIEED